MKRFNFVMQWLTIFLYVAMQPAMAGLPPTRSGGQSGSLSTTFDFKAPHNQVTKYSGTGALIETGNNNLQKNPGFEATTYSTSYAVSGGTLAAATTTNIFFSKGATWNSTAASQEFSTDLVTVPEGYVGNNCEASVYVKVPSGTATHTFRAVDNGANVLASATVVATTYFTKNTLTFPCPASGTSIAWQLISVASDEPLIALDEGYLGLARNVGVADLTTERKAWTPTGVWVSNATYTGFESRVGDTQHVWFRITLSGAPSGTLTLNIPSTCTIDTAKTTGNNARNSFGDLLIFDSDTGAQIPGKVQGSSTSAVALNVILTGNASTAPISNITATAPITFASGDTIDGYFAVPCVGWAASTVVMPDAQGWYVDVNIAGANPSLGVASVASQTEITSASLTMAPRPGSAAAGIMCSSTNAATAPSTGNTTCSAGSESIGANFNLPKSGAYEACVYFPHFLQVDSSETLTTVFQLNETPTNAQTITTTGGTRVGTGLSGTSVSGSNLTSTVPVTNCSIFNWSAGTKAIRLMYTQSVSGSPNQSLIIADQDASLSFRDIRLTVKPVTGQQQAVLANSVSTGTVNGEKLGRALISNGSTANCTASPCTVERNSTGFVSSATRSATGVYTINFTAGYFSAPPECTYAARDSAAAGSRAFCGLGGASSSTAQTIGCYREDTGVASDVFFSVICMGPR